MEESNRRTCLAARWTPPSHAPPLESESVDASRWLTLAQNFGKTNATPAMGDFDGDGTVAFPDFLLLASNFVGGRAAPTATVSVSDVFSPLTGLPTFSVTYSDNNGLQFDRHRRDDPHVVIVGPDGRRITPHEARETPNAFTTNIQVKYTCFPNQDGLQPLPNGRYSIQMVASQISDRDGNFMPAGEIASFEINVPNNQLP